MIEYFLDKRIWTPTGEELETERKWIAEKIKEIGGKNLLKLARKARNVRRNAYQPYSGYSVGAAILTTDKKVFASCNAEDVTYSADHAEASAVTKAVSSGIANRVGRQFIDAVAVCHPGDSGPCGRCRQKIIEHTDNCLILGVNADGEITKISSLKTLLPDAFGPSHLGK